MSTTPVDIISNGKFQCRGFRRDPLLRPILEKDDDFDLAALYSFFSHSPFFFFEKIMN